MQTSFYIPVSFAHFTWWWLLCTFFSPYSKSNLTTKCKRNTFKEFWKLILASCWQQQMHKFLFKSTIDADYILFYQRLRFLCSPLAKSIRYNHFCSIDENVKHKSIEISISNLLIFWLLKIYVINVPHHRFGNCRRPSHCNRLHVHCSIHALSLYFIPYA